MSSAYNALTFLHCFLSELQDLKPNPNMQVLHCMYNEHKGRRMSGSWQHVPCKWEEEAKKIASKEAKAKLNNCQMGYLHGDGSLEISLVLRSLYAQIENIP